MHMKKKLWFKMVVTRFHIFGFMIFVVLLKH